MTKQKERMANEINTANVCGHVGRGKHCMVDQIKGVLIKETDEHFWKLTNLAHSFLRN